MKTMSKRALRASLSVGAVALAATACGDSSTAPLGFEVIEDVEFHESLDVDLSEMTKAASGLYYQNLVVGEGEIAAAGSDVAVHYLLRLRNGQQVETTVGGDPITFIVDQDGIIPGFSEGVRGMRVGGERKLVIPPQLAYGTRGPEGILIFDIELVSVTNDGGT
ncbi:MAG: FKBP-type peptidyl-prolyl cis-trans isomerase [Gemmatimonadota bacterium]